MQVRTLAVLLGMSTGCYFGQDSYVPEGARQPDTTSPDGGTGMDGSVGDGSADGMDGGGDGTPGDGGDGDVDGGDDPACEQPCGSDLPVCDSASGTCIKCDDDLDCKRFDNAACGPNGNCVDCTADYKEGCAESTPACNTTTNQCVECTESDETACAESGKHCKTGGTVCVECNDNEDCKDDEPICGADNQCHPCVSDSECGSKICDEDGRLAGQCVECTEASEDEAHCGDFSCNPHTRTCTTTELGKIPTCGVCTADSECAPDHRCVPMFFNGEPHRPLAEDQGGGGYCLKIFVEGGCQRPYGAPRITRASLSGAPDDDYCGVNESKATCEAILASGEVCVGGDASTCGATSARCESVNGVANTCTYSCDDDLECRTTRKCGGGGEAGSYCGGI